MPQMMPMSWFTLNVLFTFMIILIIMKMYFIKFNLKFKTQNKTLKMKKSNYYPWW